MFTKVTCSIDYKWKIQPLDGAVAELKWLHDKNELHNVVNKDTVQFIVTVEQNIKLHV